ncbi:hypothetical protein ACE4Z5_27865, partial [Salmonella enterica]|uniref:hypothetical protein n=1 Tax=Salmonella enterica TaxID=28901 RepID=UPI003D2A5BC5
GNVTWNQILVLKGTISLGSGQVLTLANNADILTGTYLGAGKLVTTGTMTAQGITFGNGATWSVAGTVNLTSNLNLDSYVAA